MKKKYKILITLICSIIVVLGSGITYSLYISGTNLNGERNIAGFIFNAESASQLQFSLIDLKPGDLEEYPFSVSNNSSGDTSKVSIEYELTIKTYHFIPLIIELYKIKQEEEILVLTCNETSERNSNNELECTSPIQEMVHSSEENDDYKLKIEIPIEYNDDIYSDLVDYINMEINSWQKIKD